MSNYSKIYWLTRLDSIQNLLVTITVLCVIVLFVYWLIYLLNSDYEGEEWTAEYRTNHSFKSRLSIWLGLGSLLLLTLLPSKNEAILIIAGGKTMDFIEKDKSINKIPSQTTAIISKYLDETLKEMDTDKKDK